MNPFHLIIVCLLLVEGGLFTTPTQAKVPVFTLGQLVRASSDIIIGHVESVRVVSGLKVAQVTVQDTLKGHNKSPSIYVVAECTGECDVSAAIPGEQALLFLSPVPGNVVDRETLRRPSVKVGLKPLYSLAFGGRGRMPVCLVKGKAYVSEIGVWLPGIQTVPSLDHEAEYASLARSLALSNIRGLLLSQLGKGHG